jgi:hypothetical protein
MSTLHSVVREYGTTGGEVAFLRGRAGDRGLKGTDPFLFTFGNNLSQDYI